MVLGQLLSRYNLTQEFDKSIVEKFLDKADADVTVLAGCTEMAQILRTLNVDFIDPMQILSEAIVRRWYFEKTYPLISRASSIEGRGIFALQDILVAEVFYQIPLSRISHSAVPKWAHLEGRWFFDDEVVNWINHSCSPNTRIRLDRGVPVLESLQEIKEGDEITCNYNETEQGGKEISCQCGTTACKGTFKRIE